MAILSKSSANKVILPSVDMLLNIPGYSSSESRSLYLKEIPETSHIDAKTKLNIEDRIFRKSSTRLAWIPSSSPGIYEQSSGIVFALISESLL